MINGIQKIQKECFTIQKMNKMDNKTLILNEFEKYKGQHVLIGDSVYRLIGVLDDTEDYYWILFNGRDISYDSCLSRIMQLKGKLKDEDYDEILRIAKLNDYDLVVDEILSSEYKEYIQNKVLTGRRHSIIGGLYFDLV